MAHQIRLRTLGALAAASDAGPLTGAGAQRKPLALLALLAVAGDTGLTREKLCACFWPEADTERAGHGLAQMLYTLRRACGDAEIIAGSATLRLNPASVTSDVGQFEKLLAAGDLEGAVARRGVPPRYTGLRTLGGRGAESVGAALSLGTGTSCEGGRRPRRS